MWNRHALGVAFGVVYALWMLAVGVLSTAGVTPQGLIELYTRVIPGFSATPAGIITGMVGSFVMGYILGWLIAWVYNRVAGK